MVYRIVIGTLGTMAICASAYASPVNQEISVVSAICMYDSNIQELWIHGQLQNTTNKQFPKLEMSFKYLDAGGDSLGSDTAVLEDDPPSPGQSVNFHHGYLGSGFGGYMSVNIEPVNDDGTPIPNETYFNVSCQLAPSPSQ